MIHHGTVTHHADGSITRPEPEMDDWTRQRMSWRQAQSFIKSTASKGIRARKVSLNVLDQRRLSCFGKGPSGVVMQHPCPALRFKDGKHYCGACGCGDNEAACLDTVEGGYSKLEYPALECPLKRFGFDNYLPTPALAKSLKVAVIIATLNEGPMLEQTIASILASFRPPNEIVIVDDSSRAPIAARVLAMKARGGVAVRVIRNEQRLGCGASRDIGCRATSADLLIIVDAHMRFPPEWIGHMIDAHARNPNAVLCTGSTGFGVDQSFLGYGCTFEPDGHGSVEAKWTKGHPKDEFPIVPCIMGATYAVPRRILDAVGGWGPGLTGFGCDEEYLSLRAWLAGFEVRAIRHLITAHDYRDRADRIPASGPGPQADEVARNKKLVAKVAQQIIDTGDAALIARIGLPTLA